MGGRARRQRERQASRGDEQSGPEAGRGRPVWIFATVAGVVALAGAGGWRALRHRHRSIDTGAHAATSDAGPARVAEVEPNDTLAKAQALARVPAEITGTLGPGDRDVYSIAIEGTGGWLIDAFAEGLSGMHLEALGADGKVLAAVEAPARIGALGAVKGTLYLAVSGAVAGSYRLHVNRSPWVKGLDWEPDDDAEHAQELARLEPEPKQLARYRGYGWLSRPGDVDCFIIPLTVPPTGAAVRLDLQPPPGVTPELWVLSADSPETKIPRQRMGAAIAAGRGRHAVLPGLGARSWESSYVACVRAHAGEDFAQRYILDVRLWTPEGPFEFEPNDTLETASALPRDVTLSGYLTDGDVDWFRISAGPNATLEASVDFPPANVAIELSLLDAAGKELARAQGGTGKSVAVRHANPVFVRVRALTGENLSDPYKLAIRKIDAK